MTVLKAFGLLFVAYVAFHWLTAGQDEIIQGPPKDPAGISTVDHTIHK